MEQRQHSGRSSGFMETQPASLATHPLARYGEDVSLVGGGVGGCAFGGVEEYASSVDVQ